MYTSRSEVNTCVNQVGPLPACKEKTPNDFTVGSSVILASEHPGLPRVTRAHAREIIVRGRFRREGLGLSIT